MDPRDSLRHPKTVEALALGRALVHATDEMLERVDDIRARRPSPSGRVIPEVDGQLRLTDLYIAPGTIAAMDNQNLVDEIVYAIQESALDAARQHKNTIRDTVWPDIPKVPWVIRRR